MEWGAKADHFKYLADRGRSTSIPKAFKVKPVIAAENLFFWDAFWALSTERQFGMSLGPIPESALLSFSKENRIDGERYQQFRRLIRAMDNLYQKVARTPPDEDEGKDPKKLKRKHE